MRRGIRLSVDVGKARVGLAKSDPDGLLATPVATLARDEALAAIAQQVAECEPLEVVVGLPVSLSGADTASTVDARDFANELSRSVDCPVRLVDERLSSVSAHSLLGTRGMSSKKQRKVVDQVAAVIILQHSLDIERATGKPAGVLLEQGGGV